MCLKSVSKPSWTRLKDGIPGFGEVLKRLLVRNCCRWTSPVLVGLAVCGFTECAPFYSPWRDTATDQAITSTDLKGRADDLVRVFTNAVSMPVGHILLIRQKERHCAMKLVAAKLKTRGRVLWTAEYEFYSYEGDSSALRMDALKVKTKSDDAFGREVISLGHLLTFTDSGDDFVICPPFVLGMSGGSNRAAVYFYRRGPNDKYKGLELAPTKWTDSSQINLFDDHIKWYAYDESRPDIEITIDRLW